MEVIKTAIDGVVIIEPRVFKDARGYFFESFSQRTDKAIPSDKDMKFEQLKGCESQFSIDMDLYPGFE